MRSFFEPAMIYLRELMSACLTPGDIAEAVGLDEYELLLVCFDQKSADRALTKKITDFHAEYFKKYNSLNPVQLVEKYTGWLNRCYDSLKFTWNDMADKTGISRTLLKQYYNGLSSPLTARNAKKSGVHERLCGYLAGLYTCETDEPGDRYKYIRLPNGKFGEFLRELLSGFSYTINQAQLGERIGLTQGKISRIVNGSYTVTTRTQYEILKIFGQLCDAHYDVYSPLYFTAAKLKKYLFIEDYSEALCFNPVIEDYVDVGQELLEERIEETRESRLLIFRFLQYPDNVQRIILQCRNIFSNDLRDISEEQYDRFMEVIQEYRDSLAEPGRAVELLARLNAELNTKLVFDRAGDDLFDTMADFMKMTAYTRRHGAVLEPAAVKKLTPVEVFCAAAEPDMSKLSGDDRTTANRFIHIFRKELLLPVRCFENMLLFTAEEWEICRLLTLNEYNKRNIK